MELQAADLLAALLAPVLLVALPVGEIVAAAGLVEGDLLILVVVAAVPALVVMRRSC